MAVGIAVGAGVEVTTGAGVGVPCVLWLDRQPATRNEDAKRIAKIFRFEAIFQLTYLQNYD